MTKLIDFTVTNKTEFFGNWQIKSTYMYAEVSCYEQRYTIPYVFSYSYVVHLWTFFLPRQSASTHYFRRFSDVIAFLNNTKNSMTD